MKAFRSLIFILLGYLSSNLILIMTYKLPAPLSGFYENVSFNRLPAIWDDIIFVSFFYIFIGGWAYFLLFFLVVYILKEKAQMKSLPVLTLSFIWGALFSLIVLMLTSAE